MCKNYQNRACFAKIKPCIFSKLCVCLSVRWLGYLGTGRTIASKFSGSFQCTPDMVLGAKNWGSWVESRKLAFFGFLRHPIVRRQVSGRWAQAYHCDGNSGPGRQWCWPPDSTGSRAAWDERGWGGEGLKQVPEEIPVWTWHWAHAQAQTAIR